MNSTIVELAGDPSASAIKAAYNFGTSLEPKPVIIPPFLIPVLPEMLEDYSFNSTNLSGGGFVGFGDSHYLYGNLAKNSNSRLPLKARKFELALYKALILVGIIALTHELEQGTQFNIAFTLPSKEYSDWKILQKNLERALEQFNFCGENLSFKLNSFLCLPEGAPTFLQVQSPTTQQQKQVVLMVGLRDISLLTFENNQITRAFSEPLGFSKLYEIFKERFSFQGDLLQLARIISTKDFKLLLGNLNRNYHAHKLKEAKAAVNTAKKQYLLILKQLLESEIDIDTQRIIVTGGTAFYLRRELNALLKLLPPTDICFCDRTEAQIVDRFGSPFIKQNGLQYRMSEVYGLFMYAHHQYLWGGQS